MRKLTKEEFVKKAILVHGDEYDYSETEYLNYDEKLKIRCKVHGYFWQTPGNHLKGKGCPSCYGTPKKTKDEFIKQARILWGDRFDYSKVDYINNSTKVCIIDKDGKEYFQTPSNHLSGYDCSNNKLITKEDFINAANKIHHGKYSYDFVSYNNSSQKVCIECKEHGIFYQSLYNHLKGQGCPFCLKKSFLEEYVCSELEKSKISFEAQKRFKWLGKKSLDFFIPSINTAIECQGKQHFYENGRFEGFETLLKRDIEKYNLCKKNGVNIIYVVNDSFKKRIDFYDDKDICNASEIIQVLKKKEDEK